MIMMDKISSHIHVSGRVQGVAFRHYTKLHADRTGVTGWVRNRRDGTVEAVICGTKEQIEDMITWLHAGSPAAAVTNVSIAELADPETYSTFDIIY